MRRTVLLLFLLQSVLLLIAGCGGGGGTKPDPMAGSRLVFTVQWPDRSRLIPRAAESIVVRVRRDGQTVAEQTVNRPSNGTSTRIVLERLPVGELTATASAYPEFGGRGIAQASGSARLYAEAGEPFTLTVTMESTIERIDVTADRPSVFLEDSLPLTATARDRNGNVVLVGDTFRWSVSSEAVIDGSGLLTGRRVGSANVTVTETESGVRETVSVRVKGVSYIDVQPTVIRILDEDDAIINAVAYDSDGQPAPLSTGGWVWGIGSSGIARLFGSGSSIRVGGFSVGQTEITIYTVAGGSARIPVYVYPSQVSGTLSVSRSGYRGPSTVYVSGDSVFTSLSEHESTASDGLSNFPVDDSRLILVELDDLTEDFTEDDSVDFTLHVSGPTAPNGRPYFVFADSGGTSVSGTLTRSETSQVFRLIVRDPITGEARSRKSRLRSETIPTRGQRRSARPKP